MIEIKQRGTGSWFDPRSSKALAALLSTRLLERCRGEKGVAITLTYDRKKYKDGLELYRAASDEQHVPMFLRRLAKRLGENFRGRWFCKMEFQRGGYVHWHIILLGVTFIEHADLEACWGHGHVWIDRLTPKTLKYTSKYLSKAGGVPGWVFAQPPKSVKVVRVSPGFWHDRRGGSPFPGGGGGGGGEGDRCEDEPPQGWYTEAPDDEPPAGGAVTRVPMYTSIGTRIEQQDQQLVVRDDKGRYRTCVVELGRVLVALMRRGVQVLGRRRSWLVVDCNLEEWERAAGKAASVQLAGLAAERGPFHLIKSSNPDSKFRAFLPHWLDEYFAEGAS